MTKEFHPGMGQAVAERTILRKIPAQDNRTDFSNGYVIHPDDPNRDHIKLHCDTYDFDLAFDEEVTEDIEVRWETWGEVATRVAEGNTSVIQTENGELEKLENHIGKASILMSGRHLQHGDAKQYTRNMEVYTNCLEKSTKISTVDRGSQEIGSLQGETVLLIAADGQIRPATINNHGTQPLRKLSFRTKQNNGKLRHEVIATPNHRWLLEDGQVTSDIKIGDRLKPNPVRVSSDVEGKTHGLIFGDGSASTKRQEDALNTVSMGRSYAQIRVCDTGKYREVIHDLLDEQGYCYSTPPHSEGDRVYYLGKKPFIKELPTTYDPEYIQGFIEGWWLADGAKSDSLTYLEISTANEKAAQWLRDYAGYAGYTVTSERLVPRKENDGSYPNGKPLNIIRLRKDIVWVLDSIEDMGEGEVFCPEEPVTGGFLLANGLVTGNCSTSSTSFLLFYLLLNGSGVGRLYDDDMMLVDWNYMPNLRCVIDDSHPDYNFMEHESVRDAKHKYGQGENVIWFTVPDSREGWAKAVEKLEVMTFQKAYKDSILVLDFSPVREKGAPIGGMQNRPSSGPAALMSAMHKLVTLKGAGLPKWMQAMYVDHYLAEPVLVGGARRAARMAVKYWKDRSVLEFVGVKRPIEFEGKSSRQVVNLREDNNFMSFLWSSNNSVGVDADFWRRIALTPDDKNYNSELTRHARAVYKAVIEYSYGDGTGEPGFINLDQLVAKNEGTEKYESGDYVGSQRYKVELETKILLAGLAQKANSKEYSMIVNPCGEIVLHLNGAFCVIADVVAFHADDLFDAEDAFKTSARALIRVNTMDSVYDKEVKRTNRIGVGQTGVHEFAWDTFKVGFRDLVNPDFAGFLEATGGHQWTEGYLQVITDVLAEGNLTPPQRAAAFWEAQGQFSRSTMREAAAYAQLLGMNVPHTMTTIKPAGTTSKLFGLSEGWHLPALAHYLRWVQFRNDSPQVAEYEAAGYPVRRDLKTYQGTSIVGFPTQPTISSLNIGEQLVLAGDATPEEQYEWLRLGEFFWIEGGNVSDYVEKRGPREGEARYGNQISYTLKYKPQETPLRQFSDIIQDQQATVRCCSVMPQEEGQSYEYLPEEPVTKASFEQLQREIAKIVPEDIGKEHVDCEGGSCPVDFDSSEKGDK